MPTKANKLSKNLNISKPAIILDPIKVKRNINRMAEKARTSGIKFRPHFKTHQSAYISEWFKQAGVEAITVSSLSMARYFAENGWQDITIAIPINILEIELLNTLNRNIQLNIILDDANTALQLEKTLEKNINVFIKIDTGYGRAGVNATLYDDILHIANTIQASSKLNFRGLLAHPGHSYDAKTKNQILSIHTDTISKLNDLKSILTKNNFSECLISIGDTPCCSIAEDFTGVDEIRPGNFVFYDLDQLHIGSCNEDDIAVVVACPVIGKYPDRDLIVIYGGSVHFSKDYIYNEQGEKIFAYLTYLDNNTWHKANHSAYISSLSQEHGKLKLDQKLFENINIGDILLFMPVHSCLTCNQFSEYITLEGEHIPRFNSL